MEAKSPKKHPEGYDPSTKKPYEAPVLKKWGTLVEITLAMGAGGSADGGKKGPKSTRF